MKKVLTLILALLFVLSLVSCTIGTDDPSSVSEEQAKPYFDAYAGVCAAQDVTVTEKVLFRGIAIRTVTRVYHKATGTVDVTTKELNDPASSQATFTEKTETVSFAGDITAKVAIGDFDKATLALDPEAGILTGNILPARASALFAHDAGTTVSVKMTSAGVMELSYAEGDTVISVTVGA